MKFHGNKLYLQIRELIDAGIPDRTLRHWKSEEEIATLQDGGVFIPYDALRPSWKKLVDEHYKGSVLLHYQHSIMAQDFIWKEEDEVAIDNFRIPGSGLQLETPVRVLYKEACALLSWLPIGKNSIKRYGTDTLGEFWNMTYTYIEYNKMRLPASRKLEQKLRDYLEHGPVAIINGRYGNNNSTKLEEIQRLTLVELMCSPQKFSKLEVIRQFRTIAKQKGWEKALSMSEQGLYNYINASVNEWEKTRHGEKWFMLNRELSINQRRTSQPHLQWQADGTPAALWYLNEQGQPDKLYVLGIMDSHSMDIIGYGIGYTETTNLVAEGLKMAIKLQSCVPYELRSDKGSAFCSGETKALLKGLGIVLKPTGTGRARAKSIEIQQRWWMQRVCTYYLNKSGMNLNAKTMDSQQNPDFFKANKDKLPSKAELIAQIRESIALWNNLRGDDGRSPSERLMDPAPDKREMSSDKLLECFGLWRKKGKALTKYRFTLEGLEMQVNKQTFRYLPVAESLEKQAALLQQNMFVTDFYVKYDPTDIEQIGLYVSQDGKEVSEENLRFWGYAELKHLSAQYLREATEAEKSAFKKQRKIQSEQGIWIETQAELRKAALQAENILTGGLDHKTVRKDEYNQAKIELQRLAAMGYGEEIISEEIEKVHAEQEQHEKIEVTDKKLIYSINDIYDKFKD